MTKELYIYIVLPITFDEKGTIYICNVIRKSRYKVVKAINTDHRNHLFREIKGM